MPYETLTTYPKTTTSIMPPIKTTLPRQHDDERSGLATTKLINNRNRLRGTIIILTITWLIALGTVLVLMGDNWWPITLTAVLIAPVLIIPVALRLNKLNKQILTSQKL